MSLSDLRFHLTIERFVHFRLGPRMLWASQCGTCARVVGYSEDLERLKIVESAHQCPGRLEPPSEEVQIPKSLLEVLQIQVTEPSGQKQENRQVAPLTANSREDRERS